MSRISLRLKLTLAFTGVMAVLLAIVGHRAQPARGHEPGLDDRQRARGARRRRGRGRRTGKLASTGEPFAQVLAPDGSVLDTTTGAGNRPLLSPAELARARTERDLRRAHAPRGRRAAAAGPARRRAPSVLVVGESLAQRERALDALHALLAVGGPLALLIASAVGYALAAAALRPVERMRRHAAAITAAQTGERLPVPPADDEIGRLGRTLNEMLARLEVAFKRERAFVSRRLARAAHAARDPAHRARAGAARRAHARGARGGAALGRRGVRAALAAGRGPARDRALGSGPAAGAPRGAGGRRRCWRASPAASRRAPGPRAGRWPPIRRPASS